VWAVQSNIGWKNAKMKKIVLYKAMYVSEKSYEVSLRKRGSSGLV